ncbi:MAG: formate dehydrogenase subunit gamma [Cellvibrionales bacterium]|nr:MAG: formate dehydrogenase subunit gamma [Cellvibrionales bacterium]
MSPTFDKAAIDDIIAQHQALPGALLPLLHAIQHAVGYVPAEAVPAIATGLNLSRAEVHGVISFYHHFHSEPMGENIVQICRAEACQAVGARELEKHATATLATELGNTSADGEVSLEPVYCLGNCACGPSVQIGDEVYARVTPDRFDALISKLKINKQEANS